MQILDVALWRADTETDIDMVGKLWHPEFLDPATETI